MNLIRRTIFEELLTKASGMTILDFTERHGLEFGVVYDEMQELLAGGYVVKGANRDEGQYYEIAPKGQNMIRKSDSNSKPLSALKQSKKTPVEVVEPAPIATESALAQKPSHYQMAQMECIEAMKHMLNDEEFIGFLSGNVFKYLWRWRHKNGLEDLKKAYDYLGRLVQKVEAIA